MSGHKHATITANAENIRQLSQTEMAIRFVEAGLNELSDRLDYYANQDRTMEVQQAEAAQEILIQTLAQVDDVFVELEEQNQVALLQQQEQFYEELNTISDINEKKNVEQLESLWHRYRNAIEELSQYHEETIQTVVEKLERISQVGRNKSIVTRKWINASRVLLESIEDDPFVEVVSPGFTKYSTDLITLAQNNFKSGFFEAALVTAQNIYRETSQVRTKAMQEYQIYQNLTQLFQKKIELLKQEVNLNQRVHAFDLQGKPLPDEIIVDDWVEGNLSKLQRKILRAQSITRKPISLGQIKQMKQAIRQIIPQWHSMLNDFVYQARVEALNSQLRMNIALMVVRALSSQGYKLLLTNYCDDNLLADYQARLIDNEGSQILVQVEPASNQSTSAELNLYSQDANKRTPHELKRRSLEIQRVINKAGLHISELKPVQQELRESKVTQKRVKNVQPHKQAEQIITKH